nr:hypothetical protein [uncultured Flavobacterium sp.]
MSYPTTSFFVLYFIRLAILLLSDFVGLGLFRFRKNNIFFGLFLEFLLLIATYAFAQAGSNSVEIFVIVWIFGYFYLVKDKRRRHPKKRNYQLASN